MASRHLNGDRHLIFPFDGEGSILKVQAQASIAEANEISFLRSIWI